MATSAPGMWIRVLLLVVISAVIAFTIPRLWRPSPPLSDAAQPRVLAAHYDDEYRS